MPVGMREAGDQAENQHAADDAVSHDDEELISIIIDEPLPYGKQPVADLGEGLGAG